MTALANRPNTALLVIDVQNGVVGNAYDRDAAPGRTAGTVSTDGVEFAAASV